MCGIGGLVDLQGRRLPARGVLRALATSLRWRGGDGSGCLRAPGGALLHTRLALVDARHGQQPFRAGPAAGGQEVWGVLSGEVYNHLALRGELQGEGAQFHSACDAEVMPQLLLRHGLEGLGRMRGEFAGAAWDRRSGEVLLFCDPFRTKPLYWMVREGWLLFASDYRSLIAFRDRPALPDESVLRHFLSWGCCASGTLPFETIHALAPGEVLVFAPGRPEPIRRRLFPLPAPLPCPGVTDGSGSGVEAVLERVVAGRLQGDRLPGLWLSGGVDSAVLALLAQRVAGRALEAFTLGVKGPGYDERDGARRAAQVAGLRLHEAVFELRTLEDLFPAWGCLDLPLADTALHTAYALARLTVSRAKAVLSGEGADELFGGYSEYRACRYARWVPRPAFQGLAWGAGWLASGDARSAWGDLARRFARGGLECRAPHAWRWRGCVGRADLAALWAGGGAAESSSCGLEGGADPRETDLRSWLPEVLLPKADRAGLAAGVEVRLPYLDPEVVALARALPLHPGKPLLRGLLGRLSGGRLGRGPKRGFSAPLRAWLRRPAARDEVRGFLLGPAACLGSRLESRVLEGWLAEHGDRRRDRHRELHALAALEYWLRSLSRLEAGSVEFSDASEALPGAVEEVAA